MSIKDIGKHFDTTEVAMLYQKCVECSPNVAIAARCYIFWNKVRFYLGLASKSHMTDVTHTIIYHIIRYCKCR